MVTICMKLKDEMCSKMVKSKIKGEGPELTSKAKGRNKTNQAGEDGPCI